MTGPPAIRSLHDALGPLADPEQATAMAAYMKGKAHFLGVKATARRRAAASWMRAWKGQPIDAIVEAAAALWQEREREYHYIGADLLRRYQPQLRRDHLGTLRSLVVTHSWWDTVDALAAHPVGAVVQRHGLQANMDAWVQSDNLWVARTAVLHQLTYHDNTDAERLFAYCRHLAGHPDFFIRKAIGWALRTLYKTQPDAVVHFVQHTALSPLSIREALKHHPG